MVTELFDIALNDFDTRESAAVCKETELLVSSDTTLGYDFVYNEYLLTTNSYLCLLFYVVSGPQCTYNIG